MTAFHLSLPVNNFQKTTNFYCSILGGKQEKITPGWFNVNLEGHQLTFHILPGEVITNPHLHWGLVISWEKFHLLFEKLKQHDILFKIEPDYQEVASEE